MHMAIAITDPDQQKHWTAADLQALPDDGKRYEIIDGELFVSPSPVPVHQRIVGRIFVILDGYVGAHKFGEALMSPADIEFADDTVVQPDVFVFPRKGGELLEHWKDIGRLILAVEVLSPGTARTDRTDRTVKRRRYQREGVPEYWIVDSDAQVIERWRPSDDRPEILSDRLEWQPDSRYPALVVDLLVLFGAAIAG
jgi:Uma2 family endonuclease